MSSHRSVDRLNALSRDGGIKYRVPETVYPGQPLAPGQRPSLRCRRPRFNPLRPRSSRRQQAAWDEHIAASNVQELHREQQVRDHAVAREIETDKHALDLDQVKSQAAAQARARLALNDEAVFDLLCGGEAGFSIARRADVLIRQASQLQDPQVREESIDAIRRLHLAMQKRIETVAMGNDDLEQFLFRGMSS